MAQAPQIRTARVSSIDYERGTYRVYFPDRGTVSEPINAMSNGEYKMPEIGQVVSVSLNGNGTVEGATLGTVWNETNKPAEGKAGLYRKEYGRKQGDSYERYDAETGEYTQYTRAKTGRNCNGAIYDECKGTATIQAGSAVMIRSTGASVAIGAETGADITAGKSINLEAGTSVNIEAKAQLSEHCGSDYDLTVDGEATTEITGEETKTNKAKYTRRCEGDVERTVEGNVTHNVTGNVEQTVTGDVTQTVTGTVMQDITGDVTATVSGTLTLTVGGATITVDAGGNVTVTAPNITVNGNGGDVKVDGISLVHHKHKDGGAGEPEK